MSGLFIHTYVPTCIIDGIANAMGAYFLLPTIVHVHVHGCMHACKRKGFLLFNPLQGLR